MYADARAAARALRPLIESEAGAVEASGTMTEPVVDAIAETGLFRLLVPRKFDGMEAAPDEIMDVCEELSFADGSVGWAFAQNTSVHAYAAYIAPRYAKLLAASRASAGMFAPIGVAKAEEGGFRISGKYGFGSGSGHSEFMGGAAMVMHDGEVAPFIDGLPQVRAFILPSEAVKLQGNWDVMGLKGTGSFDFEVPEQYVETGRTCLMFQHETVTGGPVYGLGPIVLGTIGSVGWALGVAERALHEIAEIAKAGRTRLGSLPLREQDGFQRGYGFHQSALTAARHLAKDAYGRAVDACAQQDPKAVREDRLRETKAAASYTSEVAKAATSFAWEASGSTGIRNPSVLQRCFRDMCVGGGHQVFDDRNYRELAKKSLDLEPAPF